MIKNKGGSNIAYVFRISSRGKIHGRRGLANNAVRVDCAYVMCIIVTLNMQKM